MSKEMIVSSSVHETKIAILEDNQVVEVYFEREKEYGLAGGIHKGRVTRVLPGMQSAFVDIGVERDAFLYVSDFFEDIEEYDKIVTTVEDKVIRMEESRIAEPAAAVLESAPPPPMKAIEAEPLAERNAPAPEELRREKTAPPPAESHRKFSRRSRRQRPNRKGFPESKYARPSGPATPAPPAAPSIGTAEPVAPPVILPGESLAKYKSLVSGSSGPAAPAPEEAEPMLEAAQEGPAGSAPAGEVETGEAVLEPESQPETAEAFRELAEDLAVAVPAPEASAEAEGETQSPEAMPPSEPGDLILEMPAVVLAEPAIEPEPSEPEPGTVEAAPVPENAAAPEPEQESREAIAETGETSPAEPARVLSEQAERPQQAVVRESYRNPRYQRRGRWTARREGREDAGQRRGTPRERETAKPLIADLLKEGQEIIVQIAKEPIGKKGARITSHIALPGRYLVYMPTVEHVGVSRKIASEEERHRLKRIILENRKNISGGFIVRTAGEGHSEEDLKQDIHYLTSLWAEIRAKAERTKAPALLHHDLDLVGRTLRDQLSDDFTAVWVDNEQEYEKILSLVSKLQPALVHRVKMYTKDVPLFEEMGIQEEINKALRPKIWMKSGGYIVINQTEALVAIDVNTGKFVGKSNRLEDTIVKTNVEAIQEIVRQIRLRDLGGIIVIDFIDMDERKNRQKVMGALEDSLKADRAPSKILAFNEFGLVAITRKRVRQPLERTLCQPCPDCAGSGFVKSVMSVSLEILAEARKIASELEGKQITLRVNPEVGKALKARDNTIVAEIEELTGKGLVIRNDPALHLESFAFE